MIAWDEQVEYIAIMAEGRIKDKDNQQRKLSGALMNELEGYYKYVIGAQNE